jgi:hypothetical protein
MDNLRIYNPEDIAREVEWLRGRLTGCGGSDVPVLWLGELFGRRAWHLYTDKTRTPEQITEAEVLEGKENPAFRRGHAYEDLAIDLYREHLRAAGVAAAVHAPRDADERYGAFRLEHPDAPHRYADLDAARSDGWVVEVKSPSQGVCDWIRANGVKDYYQIQAQWEAGIADVTGCPAFGPGECKGTILVIYEPERIALQVYEIPIDREMVATAFDLADRFWFEHVVPRVPPTEWITEDVPQVSAKGGKYTPVDDAALVEAAALLQVARDTEAAAQHRAEVAKANVIELLDGTGEERVILPNKIKLSHTTQAGRTTVNVKALKADHPEIDWTRYEVPGKPYRVFRVYGLRKHDPEELEIDAALGTVSGDLDAYARRQWSDLEEAATVFDELRGRVEFYRAALAAELRDIDRKLDAAAEAATKLIETQGGAND